MGVLVRGYEGHLLLDRLGGLCGWGPGAGVAPGACRACPDPVRTPSAPTAAGVVHAHIGWLAGADPGSVASAIFPVGLPSRAEIVP